MSYKLTSPTASLGVQKKDPKLQFMLTGFKPDLGFRIFTFESNAVSGPKVNYSVKVDLSLARKYGIQTQALPLLCFALLERRNSIVGTTETAFTYSEDEMCIYARTCKEERAAAILKKQSVRKALVASHHPVAAEWQQTAVPQTTV